MSGYEATAPYEPPDVEGPSRAQREALLAASERLCGALPQAWGLADVTCAVAAAPQEAALLESALPVGTWAVGAVWGAEQSRHLLLSAAAMDILLAALLGQERVAEHAVTDLDLRLLQLPVRAVAAEVAREWPAGGETTGLTLARGNVARAAGPVVVWRLQLQYAGQTGDAVLAVAWSALSAQLTPPPNEARLQAAELIEAPVLVEAILAAPALTPGELAEMAPGDVLSFGPGEHPTLLRANGRAIARGRVGAKGGRLAVNIQQMEPVKEE